VPVLAGREQEYLAECITGGFVSSVGPFVDRFEREFAARVGAPRAAAMASGTAALHIALLLAGVLPGSEVVVSDVTFIAPANAIRYVGAYPVFVGADEQYWQIDPESVRSFFAEACERRDGGLFNRHTGRRVQALIAVHILGHPCDIQAIADICAEYNVTLIEDAAEAVGTLYKGEPVGRHGAAAGFSFNGNKLITSGGGGMLVTRNEEWLDRAKYLSTQAKDDPIEYEHHSVGFNYRLTNLQAAVGCAQLEQLDGFIARRREIAARYGEAFAGIPGLSFMQQAPWARSTYWLSTVRIDEAVCGMGSREVLRRLSSQGIQTRPLWQPMHVSRAFEGCFSWGCDFDTVLHREALSLPSSSNLTDEEQDRVITAIFQLLRHG
jgi:perosamine synthetase